ncbi:hypothetical protein [Halomonas sp. NO4]|uniref:hypothetical protein n=1 Tax=Halomonas sp. NO4 TaxID=2484813 RepID=UPI0013D315B1|nr:hypothetical protein [Halomonas sp. NO4]
MAMPAMPNVTGGAAGPSSAADTGDVSGMGGMSVGDYYARGSRVRKDNGLGWVELAVIGAVALGALWVWRN